MSTSIYPNNFDSFVDPNSSDAMNTPSHATEHTLVNDAIEAIEAELGLGPKGTDTSVKARLNRIDVADAATGASLRSFGTAANQVVRGTHTHTLESLTDINISSPTDGQTLVWNGTKWVNRAIPSPTASGSVTGPFVQGALIAGTLYEGPVIITHNKPIPTTNVFYVDPSGDDTNPGTVLAPVQTIGHALNMGVGGRTVVLRQGTYRESLGNITTTATSDKSFTIMAYPGEVVWVKGSRIFNTWTFDSVNSVWWTTFDASTLNRTHAPSSGGGAAAPYAYPDEVVAGETLSYVDPAAGQPDGVWINGVPLKQVLVMDAGHALGSGQFYVEVNTAAPTNSKVYVKDDPISQIVEITVEHFFGQFNGNSVTQDTPYKFIGFGIAHYGGTYNFAGGVGPGALNAAGALIGNQALITLDSMSIAHNASRGLQLVNCDNSITTNSLFIYNGLNGVAATGTAGLTFATCRMAFSNSRCFSVKPSGFAQTAGMKITSSSGILVHDCMFDFNRCNGLWFDVGCDDKVVVHNTMKDNFGWGFTEEIGQNSAILSNLFLHNGFDNRNITTGVWDPVGKWNAYVNADGARLSGVFNATVWNNASVNNANAQFAIYEDGRTYSAADLNFHVDLWATPTWSVNGVYTRNDLVKYTTNYYRALKPFKGVSTTGLNPSNDTAGWVAYTATGKAATQMYIVGDVVCTLSGSLYTYYQCTANITSPSTQAPGTAGGSSFWTNLGTFDSSAGTGTILSVTTVNWSPYWSIVTGSPTLPTKYGWSGHGQYTSPTTVPSKGDDSDCEFYNNVLVGDNKNPDGTIRTPASKSVFYSVNGKSFGTNWTLVQRAQLRAFTTKEMFSAVTAPTPDGSGLNYNVLYRTYAAGAGPNHYTISNPATGVTYNDSGFGTTTNLTQTAIKAAPYSMEANSSAYDSIAISSIYANAANGNYKFTGATVPGGANNTGKVPPTTHPLYATLNTWLGSNPPLGPVDYPWYGTTTPVTPPSFPPATIVSNFNQVAPNNSRNEEGYVLFDTDIPSFDLPAAPCKFVDPVGGIDDAATRDGSTTQPWKTIGFAIGRIESGTIATWVIVRSITGQEAVCRESFAGIGTGSKVLGIQAERGARVWLDGANVLTGGFTTTAQGFQWTGTYNPPLVQSTDVNSTLTAPIDATTTLIPVADRGQYPSSGQFRVKFDSEEMLVTGGWAASGAGNLTVQRHYGGTAAATHTSGARGYFLFADADMVFIDGVPLTRQYTPNPAPDTFYIDRANTTLYLGSDPTSHIVEAVWRPSVQSAIGTGNPKANFAFRGIGIRRYGPDFRNDAYAAFRMTGSNQRMEYVTFCYNTGQSFDYGGASGLIMDQVIITNSSALGMHCYLATNTRGSRMRINRSNREGGFGTSGVSARTAAAKLTKSNGESFDQCIAHNNQTDGWWWDVTAQNVTVTRYTALDNTAQGLVFEIGATAKVVDVLLARNSTGLRVAGWDDVEMAHVTAVDNGRDFWFYEDSRSWTPNADTPGTHLTSMGDNVRIKFYNCVGFGTARIGIGGPTPNCVFDSANYHVVGAAAGQVQQTEVLTTEQMFAVNAYAGTLVCQNHHNAWGRISSGKPLFKYATPTTNYLGSGFSAQTTLTLAAVQSRSGSPEASSVYVDGTIGSHPITDYFPNANSDNYSWKGYTSIPSTGVSTLGATVSGFVATTLGVANGTQTKYGYYNAPLPVAAGAAPPATVFWNTTSPWNTPTPTTPPMTWIDPAIAKSLQTYNDGSGGTRLFALETRTGIYHGRSDDPTNYDLWSFKVNSYGNSDDWGADYKGWHRARNGIDAAGAPIVYRMWAPHGFHPRPGDDNIIVLTQDVADPTNGWAAGDTIEIWLGPQRSLWDPATFTVDLTAAQPWFPVPNWHTYNIYSSTGMGEQVTAPVHPFSPPRFNEVWGSGARTANFSDAGGMITLNDKNVGRIDHALHLGIPATSDFQYGNRPGNSTHNKWSYYTGPNGFDVSGFTGTQSISLGYDDNFPTTGGQIRITTSAGEAIVRYGSRTGLTLNNCLIIAGSGTLTNTIGSPGGWSENMWFVEAVTTLTAAVSAGTNAHRAAASINVADTSIFPVGRPFQVTVQHGINEEIYYITARAATTGPGTLTGFRGWNSTNTNAHPAGATPATKSAVMLITAGLWAMIKGGNRWPDPANSPSSGHVTGAGGTHAVGSYVPPATGGNGITTGTLPLGVKVGIPAGVVKPPVLDPPPAVSPPTHLSFWGSLIWDALQTYGAYLGDGIGGPNPQFYADGKAFGIPDDTETGNWGGTPIDYTEFVHTFASWPHTYKGVSYSSNQNDMMLIVPQLRVAAKDFNGATVTIGAWDMYLGGGVGTDGSTAQWVFKSPQKYTIWAYFMLYFAKSTQKQIILPIKWTKVH